MGRRNRREPIPEPTEIKLGSFAKVENHADGQWKVQYLTGATSVKDYTCPGCNGVISMGTPHVVAWHDDASKDDRRHWHTACWKRRVPRKF